MLEQVCKLVKQMEYELITEWEFESALVEIALEHEIERGLEMLEAYANG